ncbi:uncharacterized protein C8R40DRAFT_335311 [Lentinula edodes]|uniref:uncharacterized protein n=1 Tax=Lentinula edodes TaxID=5353 RepID=UPI001E8D5A8A|nr:uncharacterized protein C8R40DRAFT_335311 [Lentinula edodes]KAH7874274.1 hypothetical protein C8R40DRAFT_335311 [Lentinula edodes]
MLHSNSVLITFLAAGTASVFGAPVREGFANSLATQNPSFPLSFPLPSPQHSRSGYQNLGRRAGVTNPQHLVYIKFIEQNQNCLAHIGELWDCKADVIMLHAKPNDPVLQGKIRNWATRIQQSIEASKPGCAGSGGQSNQNMEQMLKGIKDKDDQKMGEFVWEHKEYLDIPVADIIRTIKEIPNGPSVMLLHQWAEDVQERMNESGKQKPPSFGGGEDVPVEKLLEGIINPSHREKIAFVKDPNNWKFLNSEERGKFLINVCTIKNNNNPYFASMLDFSVIIINNRMFGPDKQQPRAAPGHPTSRGLTGEHNTESGVPQISVRDQGQRESIERRTNSQSAQGTGTEGSTGQGSEDPKVEELLNGITDEATRKKIELVKDPENWKHLTVQEKSKFVINVSFLENYPSNAHVPPLIDIYVGFVQERSLSDLLKGIANDTLRKKIEFVKDAENWKSLTQDEQSKFLLNVSAIKEHPLNPRFPHLLDFSVQKIEQKTGKLISAYKANEQQPRGALGYHNARGIGGERDAGFKIRQVRQGLAGGNSDGTYRRRAYGYDLD